MMSMQKTTFGSRFMVFEKDSYWYDAIFKNCNRTNKQITPVDPTKRKRGYSEADFSECNEIVILQIQREDNNFMIEYVYK